MHLPVNNQLNRWNSELSISLLSLKSRKGCGKKRTSSHPPYPIIKRAEIEDKSQYNSNDYIAEGLSDLIDINAEPAVENVQKQIMSQAKIYEAIKEASKEIFRQKNRQRLHNLQAQLEQDKLEDNDNV